MHEMGITRNIVAIVSEHAGPRKVRRVRLEVGMLSAVVPECDPVLFRRGRQGDGAGRRRVGNHGDSRLRPFAVPVAPS